MIYKKYVLFTRISILKSQDGKFFTLSLWAKDLKLHLNYISNFNLCCPVVNVSNESELSGLEEITDLNVKNIFALKKDAGLFSVLKNFFPNFITVMKACRFSEIIHSGGAGWAFPLSFYILVLRPFFTFQWIIVIESSFWMLRKNEKVTIRKFIDHHLHSILLKQCVKSADARIFTQTFYKDYFIQDNERVLIAPATWVDETHIINIAALKNRMSVRNPKPIEILFPARLEENKGIYTVLDAIKILSTQVTEPINITLMGAGPLANECKEFSDQNYGHVHVSFHEPVEYGKVFFELLSQYDVVLVANLAEEQPRIIFDAFSQGCAVIASDTSGIVDITNNEQNVLLFKRGDAQSLAERLVEIMEKPDRVFKLGQEALNSVKNKTHIQMHLDRERFLKSTLKC